MSVAADAKVTNLDRMRPHVANQSRTHQKSIAIKFDAAPIVVVMKTSLNRVALANEVLAKDVGDVNVLMARVEAIEAAVGVLLQHREVGGVELNAIVVGGAETSAAPRLLSEKMKPRKSETNG